MRVRNTLTVLYKTGSTYIENYTCTADFKKGSTGTESTRERSCSKNSLQKLNGVVAS